MKQVLFCISISILFLINTSMSQVIKSFDCIVEFEDSISIIYSLKIKFDSTIEKEKRIELVKGELEKKYQVKSDNIISIEAFLDKHHKTYRYRIKVLKDMPQKETEQVQVQHPNTNGNEMLSTQEAELLNSLLEKSRNTFDFYGKRIAFITGSTGNRILMKSEYFKTCIDPWITKGDTPQISMVLLTSEEKDKSGGYDVFVLAWVKVFTDKQKSKIVKRLANGG